MESGQWLKVGAIVAMVLGALYVLMPTIVLVVEGPDVMKTEEAGPATKTGKKHVADTHIRLTVADASAADVVAGQIETRLSDADIPFDRVHVLGNGEVEVILAPGGRREKLEAAVTGTGPSIGLYDLATSGLVPPADPDAPVAPDLPSLIGLPIPPTATPLPYTITAGTRTGTSLDATLAGLDPALTGPIVIALDGTARGVATVDLDTPAPDDVTITGLAPESAANVVADIERALRGPLSSPVTVVAAKTKDDTQQQQEELGAKDPVYFPTWFIGMLPPTTMQLGLDLQGGIDLTLQVELDEAVLAAVSRDSQTVQSNAKTDGLAIDSVTRRNVEPVMEIRGGVPVGDLQSWMKSKLPTYDYLDTTTDEGGVAVHSFQLRESEQAKVRDGATDQVLDTLRKRIDETGVKEPTIVKKGTGRINIQLPGLVDLQQAIDAIGTTAVLEFRLVDEDFDGSEGDRMLAAAKAALPEDQFLDDDMLNRWLHEQNRLPDNRILLWHYKVDVDGNYVRNGYTALIENVVLTGNDIAGAGVNWNENREPYVALEFKPRGSSIFCQVTTENTQKRFAIILDNEIRSTPVIRDRICGGRASIEMGQEVDALDSANTLALVLRTGSLNAPVTIGEVRSIGAQLGKDAIFDGALGTIIGASLVFVYMLLWYRVSGLVANVTLLLNVLLCFSILAMFGATLTLPGICGIALTVGMAVDANIIVYERIREEMRLGVNSRKSVEVGFDRAWSAIMDANVAHAIAGIVLYTYGTGPIKGFAVTLLIGIVTTVVTALFVTRTLMEVLTRNSNAKLSI